MKKILVYIISLLGLCVFASCAQEDSPQNAKSNTITFVAEPAAYEGDGLHTKSDNDYETISSLYLLLIDNDGKLIENFTDMTNQSYVYIHQDDAGEFPGMTAYLFANFTDDFISSLVPEETSEEIILEELAYTIDNVSIKPTSGNISGVPMVAKVDVTAADLGKIKNIPLKRLFARVDVNITADYSFTLESYTLTNLPKKVSLFEETTINWSDDDFITSTIDVSSAQTTPIELPTIYIPEYLNSSKPLFLTLKGVYKKDKDWGARAEYTIYLGGDNNSSYDLVRNYAYNNSIKIDGVDNAIDDERVNYIGHNLADPGCTGNEEAANCYIISQPGRYIFPAVKGAGNPGNLDPVDGSGGQVISDGKNSITNVKRVNAKGEDDEYGAYISFDVTSVKDGNLVLPVDDWSWHLWFCEEAPGVHNYPAGSGVTAPVLMDRNLGAGPDDGILVDQTYVAHPRVGTYYQKDNKNPLFDSVSKGRGYHGQGDAADLWYTTDGSKSATDPCPPGYKIPSSDVWTEDLSDDDYTRYLIDGSFLYSEDLSKLTFIRYPYSSYLRSDYSIAPDDKITHSNKDSEPRGDKFSYSVWGQSISGEYKLIVNYGGTTNKKVALLHSTDEAIEGLYSKYEVDTNNAKFSFKAEYTVKILGRQYSDKISYDNKTIQQIKDYKIADIVKVGTIIPNIDSILGEMLNLLKNYNNQNMYLNKLSYGDADGKVSQSHGLQVRCVVDE